MRFQAMEPLQERFPNVEVSDGQRRFDLHNECVVSAIEFHFGRQQLVLRFRCSKAVSGASQTKTTGIVLELQNVSVLDLSGNLAGLSPNDEPLGLDSIEYTSNERASGHLRFIFDNLAEISVAAETCRLKLVGNAV
jgi:hypothetical protein